MNALNWRFLATGRTLVRAALAGAGAWLVANPTAVESLPHGVGPALLAVAAAVRSGEPSGPRKL